MTIAQYFLEYFQDFFFVTPRAYNIPLGNQKLETGYI